MQTNPFFQTHATISFYILTEHISFIPDNILNRCQIIRLKRPTKKAYMKINSNITFNCKLDNITNIKQLIIPSHTINTMLYYPIICNQIINAILLPKLDFFSIRKDLYQIFIYQLDLFTCLWYILCELIKIGYFSNIINQIKLWIDLYVFLRRYNNNYRPIYHLEQYLYGLILYGNCDLEYKYKLLQI